MALSLGGSSRVDIHVDNPHGDDDRTFPPEPATASQKGALQCLSLSQVQNHQRDVPLTQHKGLRVGVNRKATSEAFRDASDHFTKVQPSSQSDKNHRNRRTSRRVLHPLETVPENKSPEFSVTDTESKTTQHYLELSARQFPQHPILAAAGRIPSADIQHQKHQSGDFEWVLVINQPPVQATAGPRVDSGAARKLYLGCNLYPQAQGPGSGNASSDLDTGLVLLLVTPLEGDYEDLERACTDFARTPQIMAVSEKTDNSSTLSTNQQSNQSTAPPRFVITVSDTEESQAQDSLVGGSETDSVARIEDSFEALDKLEDQLEAFDEAAHFKRVTIAEPPPSGKSNDLAPSTPSARPNLPFKHGSASVRVKPVSRPGQSTLRKSLSMVFDSSKVKKEEKPSVQLPSRPSRTRAPGFVPPKPPVKSTKPLTIPSFELPGEATARRLKEQREARIAAQSAAEEAAKANARGGTLRRSKSARLTELPTFELPGEAISRRKREELNRQLKAQEEEERKRREFKARPIGAACAVAFIPRDTLASRARQQNKVATTENESLRFPPQNNSKRNSTDAHMLSRGPLEAASNLGTPRGRPLLGESRPTVRAASHASSNGSLGQSSSVSAEDMQQQRRKGEDIYRGDSFFAKDKELEKRGREQAAKVARAEAAEWSRLQSREWAIKQARKRTTIGSLRDLQV